MTHDQIREMVRRVNPIPDPSMLEIVDVPVLTTPLERRMEMQIDDRPTEVEADPESAAWSPGRDRGSGGGDPDRRARLLPDQGQHPGGGAGPECDRGSP